MCADNMALLVFDGSNLDAGVDFPLHWMPNLQTVVREGMFAVVDGMDLPVVFSYRD